MGRTEVPITPAVLKWAIRESGHLPEEIAQRLKIDTELLREWMEGESQPTLTQIEKLSSTLKRPIATFLLPSAPTQKATKAEFRAFPGGVRKKLLPKERVYLREAARFQRTLSWILRELGASKVQIPAADLQANSRKAAAAARKDLDITIEEQFQWSSSSEALQAWRDAIERRGVAVFLFSIGRDSCRGFSLWDDWIPIIAINTWWNQEARIFSLFHEYGHLVTRTGSVCPQDGRVDLAQSMDSTERWCEEFAAAMLMPADAFTEALSHREIVTPVTELSDVQRIARDFRVSLKAAAIRLIGRGLASWDLYAEIPMNADLKAGGGGGHGRNRTQIKEDQYGSRAPQILLSAIEQDLMDPTDVLAYLDIPHSDLLKMERSKRTELTE